jgi:hypothetical protein
VNLLDWILLVGGALMVLALADVATQLGRSNRHLSNIADRLNDIDTTLRKRG